jgi:hypothetical protein
MKGASVHGLLLRTHLVRLKIHYSCQKQDIRHCSLVSIKGTEPGTHMERSNLKTTLGESAAGSSPTTATNSFPEEKGQH